MFGMNQYPPPPVAARQAMPVGQWWTAGSYQEMLSIPVPLAGAPVIVSLENEPTQYVIQMQNGQKVVTGFTVTPLPGAKPQQSDVESRLANLESMLNDLRAALGEGTKNESDAGGN